MARNTSLASKAKRRLQVRNASRRRRAKQKSEQQFIEHRLAQLKYQIAAVQGDDPLESPTDLADMSDDDFAQWLEDIVKPLRSSKRLRVLARAMRGFDHTPTPSDASRLARFSEQLNFLPMVDAVTAHEAVRIAVTRLDTMVPGPADIVKSTTGVAWHADLWVRDTALHFRCTRTQAATCETDPSSKLWEMMKTPHQYMSYHPAEKQYEVHASSCDSSMTTLSLMNCGAF
ncbi:hypothetical protein PINS_up023571 [Pythium insidiosum]|nr:hypothetical protein PINS_up023571 [Pythium insidiosum]